MIRSEHIREEIKKIDEAIKSKSVNLNNVVKAITLIVKLLQDIRSNQTAIMEKTGVKLRTKPNTDSSKK